MQSSNYGGFINLKGLWGSLGAVFPYLRKRYEHASSSGLQVSVHTLGWEGGKEKSAGESLQHKTPAAHKAY